MLVKIQTYKPKQKGSTGSDAAQEADFPEDVTLAQTNSIIHVLLP